MVGYTYLNKHLLM